MVKYKRVIYALVLLPESFYLFLTLSWIIRGYTEINIIPVAFLVWVLLRIKYFNLFDLIRFGFPILLFYIILIVRDIVYFGVLRDTLVYGAYSFMFGVVLLSTLFPVNSFSAMEKIAAFKCLSIALLFIFLVSYFVPAVAQIDFLESYDFTGRWFVGDSANPIWTAYAATIFFASFFLMSVRSSCLAVVVFVSAYYVSKNDAQFLLVLLLIIAFAFQTFRWGKFSLFVLFWASILLLLVILIPYVVNFFAVDSSTSTRLLLLDQAFGKISVFGDPTSVFYVDLPLVELALEVGFFVFFIVFFLIKCFIFIMKQSYYSDFSRVVFISSCGVLFVASVHYRPFDYSFFVPVIILVHWYLSQKRNCIRGDAVY